MIASRVAPSRRRPRICCGLLVLIVLAAGCCCFQPLLPVVALPAGFIDEAVVRINEVVDMAFVGHVMLAVTKAGTVHRFNVSDPNAVEAVEILDLTDRLCENGERGYVTDVRL